MNINAAFEEWASILGQGRILSEADAQIVYGRCTTGERRRILGAVRPRDCNELPAIITVANRRAVPLYAISTGRNWGYGTALPVDNGCVLMDLSELNRIVDFDSESGVVTLEPGVTQGMLAEFLDRGSHSYMVPVTGAGPSCSIIGNTLERGYGISPHSDHFGAVTALEAVLADGRVYRSAMSESNGGPLDRVFKWGIGPYVDGLFTQSGLGVVIRMSVVLARRPESLKIFIFGLDGERDILDIVPQVREVLVRYPGVVGGVKLMNFHQLLAMTAEYPDAVPEASKLITPEMLLRLRKKFRVPVWTGFGTLYGSKGVVAAAEREIHAVLRSPVKFVEFISPRRVESLSGLTSWLPSGLRARFGASVETLNRSMELVGGRPNEMALALAYWLGGHAAAPGIPLDPARDGRGLIWYAPLVPMKADCIADYLSLVGPILRDHEMEPLISLTSMSDRCFDSTIPLLFDASSDYDRNRAERCYWALLEAGKDAGFLPYRVGIQTMRWLSAGGGTYWQVVREIKRALDPNSILSPGRYV
jgi:FAD/FMN-containing dehydrogenase